MSGRGKFAIQARISRGAMYILFVSVGLSMIYLLGNEELKIGMSEWLVATGDSVWGDLKVWQLVTSPLLEVEFISLIFQGFMLWMFLPTLERWWGTKRFITFALITCVVGTACGSLVGAFVSPGVPIAGLDPFVFGGIVAYGVLFASQPVQFFGVLPMTGRQLTIGICGFVLLFIVLGQAWAEGASSVSAMLVGWAMTSDKFSFKLWRLKHKQAKARRHLKLVRDDDDDEKKWLN